MKILIETTINAPRDSVFALALDVENWPRVISATEKVEMLTPGPVGVGTRIRETRNMWGQSASEDMTFSEIVENEKFVLTAQSNGTAYISEHFLEDAGEGTRFTQSFEGKPVSWLAWLMMPVGWLMAGSLRKMLAKDLAELKAAAERVA